jgi:hypothetical protein
MDAAKYYFSSLVSKSVKHMTYSFAGADLWDFYRYDPASATWTDLTDISASTESAAPSARSHFGFATADGHLYVFAGSSWLDAGGYPVVLSRSC